MDNLIKALQDHIFFKDFDQEYLTVIAGHAQVNTYEKDSFVFHEGNEADKFHLITQGKVAIELYSPRRGVISIQTLENVLGWSWLVPPFKRHFDARALTLVRTISIDVGWIREKCEQDTKLGYAIMKRLMNTMEDRLQATRLQLLDIYQ